MLYNCIYMNICMCVCIHIYIYLNKFIYSLIVPTLKHVTFCERIDAIRLNVAKLLANVAPRNRHLNIRLFQGK